VLAEGAGERIAEPSPLCSGEVGQDGGEVGLVLRAAVAGLVEQLDLCCQVGMPSLLVLPMPARGRRMAGSRRDTQSPSVDSSIITWMRQG
jgi:hypothetical protein